MNQFQHYVPQFLLRHFASNKKNLLWVFPIKDGEWLKQQQPVKKSCGSFNLYDTYDGISTMNKVGSLEDHLSKLEGKASRVLRKIFKKRKLNEQERTDFSFFLGFLKCRTPKSLNSVEHLLQHSIGQVHDCMFENDIDGIASKRNEIVGNLIKEGKTSEAQTLKELTSSSNLEINILNNQILDLAFTTSLDLSKILYHMQWEILETSTNSPFLISDNPVVFFNPRNLPHRLYSQGILASEEATSYVPISSQFCLKLSWGNRDFVLTMLHEKEKDYKKVVQHLQAMETKIHPEEVKEYFKESFRDFYRRKESTNIEDSFRTIDSEELAMINKLTIENSDERLFSSTKIDINLSDCKIRKFRVQQFGNLSIFGEGI